MNDDELPGMWEEADLIDNSEPTIEDYKHHNELLRKRLAWAQANTRGEIALAVASAERRMEAAVKEAERLGKLLRAKPSMEFVAVRKEALARVYDCAVSSPFLGSGFWEAEDLDAAAEVARVLGVEFAGDPYR